MRKYSPEIAEAIKNHIKENDLHMVSFDETLGSFSFNIQLACQLSTNIIIRVGEDSFTAMAVCPVRPDTSDAELMATMAEFVCRANYGLKNGYFEFDFTDGELRYKCYVPCDDRIPSQELIRESITVPAAMLRRYAPGVLGVLYSGVDPATAVKACEEDSVALRAEAMKRARREALLHKLDSMANATKVSGALPSFDEFVNMDSHPNAAPGNPDAPAEPADDATPGSDSGEDNGNAGE